MATALTYNALSPLSVDLVLAQLSGREVQGKERGARAHGDLSPPHVMAPPWAGAAPLSMAACHILLAKTEGRDRCARTWMFFMKFVRGALYLQIKRERGGGKIRELKELKESGSPKVMPQPVTVADGTTKRQLSRAEWWVQKAELQVWKTLTGVCLARVSLHRPIPCS